MGRRRQELQGHDDYAADVLLHLDDDFLRDPERLTKELHDLHAAGYRAVLIAPRLAEVESDSPAALSLCEHGVSVGRELGLGVWVRVDVTTALQSLVRRAPERRQELLVWATAAGVDGEAPLPLRKALLDCVHVVEPGEVEVVAVYARRQGEVRRVDVEVSLREGEQSWRRVAVWEPGELDEHELAVFARVQLDTFDYASLGTVRHTRDLVRRVASRITEPFGLWCDDAGPPVHICGWQAVPVSPSFYAEFKDRHAYDLRDRLPSLAWDTEDTARARLDICSTWRDMAFRAKSVLRTEAAEQVGRDINVGHLVLDTPWRRLDAVRIAPDHFRFAEATQTGAFVGMIPPNDESMSWELALARSLGKYCGPGSGYVVLNQTTAPQEQLIHRANQMCAQSVRCLVLAAPVTDARPNSTPGQVWNSAGRSAEQGAMDHSAGGATREKGASQSHTCVSVGLGAPAQAWARGLNARLAWVGEKTHFELPRANVAVIYNWRSGVRFWDERADLFRRSLARLTETLTKQNVAFDIVSPEVMSTAEDMTPTGGFTRKEETYEAIIYPWPITHTALDWEILIGYLEEGGKAILYGYPPEIAGNTGAAGELQRLVGCEIPPAEAAAVHRLPVELNGQTLPVVDEGPMAFLEAEGEAPLRTTSGCKLGVRNEAGTCFYLSYDAGLMTPSVFEPLLSLLGVRPLVSVPRGVTASLIGNRVVCAAEPGRSLEGVTVIVGDHSVEILARGELAVVDLESEQAEVFGA